MMRNGTVKNLKATGLIDDYDVIDNEMFEKIKTANYLSILHELGIVWQSSKLSKY